MSSTIPQFEVPKGATTAVAASAASTASVGSAATSTSSGTVVTTAATKESTGTLSFARYKAYRKRFYEERTKKSTEVTPDGSGKGRGKSENTHSDTQNINEISDFKQLKLDLERDLRRLLASTNSVAEFFGFFDYFKECFQLDINAQDPLTGRGYLHIAFFWNDEAAIRLLLEKYNADPCLQDFAGKLPMDLTNKTFEKELELSLERARGTVEAYKAFMVNLARVSFDEFKKILAENPRLSPNAQTKKHVSFLFKFSTLCDLCVDFNLKMQFLMNERGGNVNLIDITESHRNTILHFLLINEVRVGAFKFLTLASNPARKNLLNPNIKDCNGRTILMLAIIIGFDEFIESLIQKREHLSLDLNAVDQFGCTALHYACILRNEKAFEWLVTHGASTHVRNIWGNIAADYLQDSHQSFRSGAMRTIQHIDFVRQFMQTLTMNVDRARNAPANTVQSSGHLVAELIGGLITKKSLEAIKQKLGEKRELAQKTPCKVSAKLIGFFFDNLQEYGIVASPKEMHISREELYAFDAGTVRPCADDEWKAFVEFRTQLSTVSLAEHILSPSRAARMQFKMTMASSELREFVLQRPVLPAIKTTLKSLPNHSGDVNISDKDVHIILSYLQLELEEGPGVVSAKNEQPVQSGKPLLMQYQRNPEKLSAASATGVEVSTVVSGPSVFSSTVTVATVSAATATGAMPTTAPATTFTTSPNTAAATNAQDKKKRKKKKNRILRKNRRID